MRSSIFLITLLFAMSNRTSLYSQSIQGSLTSIYKIYEKHIPYSGATNSRLFEIAWKGERIINQIMLWAENKTIGELDYVITDLTGSNDTLSAKNMNVKFINYIKADRITKPCSEYEKRDTNDFAELGDALSNIPIKTLSPEDPIKIWLTIDVPASIDTGIYCGTFLVRANGKPSLSFEILVRVTDWLLPERIDWDFHLDLWQYPTRIIDRYNDAHPANKFAYWSKEHFSLLKKMYSILADKGQKVITAHIKKGALDCPSMVRWERSGDGIWKYDFSIFDQYVDSLMKWGISEQISCHSPIGWSQDEIPYWDELWGEYRSFAAPIGSPEYAERWHDFLTNFKQHLDSKGWFEKAVLFMDEIPEDQMKTVIAIIKNNNLDWKIGIAGFHPLSTNFLKNIDYLSLMYNVPYGTIDPNRFNTFYFSCNPPSPNNFIASDAHAAGNTLIGWYARSKNLTGFLRWAYDNWVEANPEEIRNGAHTSGDYCLVYRNSNQLDMEFMPSIRLELIREGIQDFEKIKVLEDRLMNSNDTNDALALKLLHDKIGEFSTAMNDPVKITELVLSAQKLILDVISGNLPEEQISKFNTAFIIDD